MPDSLKVRPSHFKSSLYWLLFWIPFVYWVYCAWPWLWQAFDLDPSDGDVVNAGLRVSQGLPIYGDWKRSEIYGNYGPLYYFLIAIVSKVFHASQLLVALRFVNLLLIFSSFLAGIKLIKRLSPASCERQPMLVFSILFWIVLGETYIGALTLQSNALFLSLQAWGLFCCLARTKHWALGIGIAALLPLVKQSGLAASASMFVVYLIHLPNRERLKMIVFSFTVFLALIGALEVWTDFSFIKASFLFPQEVFSNPGTWSLEHPKFLLTAFFRNQLWFFYGSIVFILWAALKLKSLRFVAIFMAMELVMFQKIGHNIGGSIVYLFFYGFLTALGLALAPLSPSLQLRKPSLQSKPLSLKFLFFAGLLTLGSESAFFMFSRYQKRLGETKMVQKLQEQSLSPALTDLLKRNQSANWFANRYVSPLIHHGILLDVEACTLQFALEKEGFIDIEGLKKRFISGHYQFVWYSDFFKMPLIETWLSDCYQPVQELQWTDRSKPMRVTIYQFKSRSCPNSL